MRRYRSGSELLTQIDQVLAEKYSPAASPLGAVMELLQSGRNYSWMGIFVALKDGENRQFAGLPLSAAEMEAPEHGARLVVPIKLPGRMLGVIDVETSRPGGFPVEDRRLLAEVARRLACFLADNGRYVLFRARQQQPLGEEREVAGATAAGEQG